MRLFVAVDPGSDCLEQIEKAASSLRKKAPSAKWVRAEGMHLTLVFLGEVPDETLDAVIEAARGAARVFAPMRLRFEGGGCFGGRKPRVLWVGVHGELNSLVSLQKSLSSALVPVGYTPEERAFSAHLTLARARDARGDAAFSDCAAALSSQTFGETNVTEIVVYRSELGPAGARYTAMARLPLGEDSKR